MGTKKSKKSNFEGQDMISNLPDFIIGHILSFLPTKDSVLTSVLSKRWISLWTFITKLELEGTHCRRKRMLTRQTRETDLMDIVEKVLPLLNAPSIKSFSLSLSNKNCPNPNHFKQYKPGIWVPLLKSRSLEKLALNMNGCAMRLPTFGFLSSLIVFKLSGIVFPYGSEHVSLSFPLLREYETKNCFWSNLKGAVVTLEVPMLEVFSIEHRCLTEDNDDSGTKIKFCAPRLTEFSLIGGMEDTILLDLDLSTAHIASAIIDAYKVNDFTYLRTTVAYSELLKQINNNVEHLKFAMYSWFEIDQMDDLPAFGMLNHLEPGCVTNEVLFIFLHKTPLLKTLTLAVSYSFTQTTISECQKFPKSNV